MTMRTWKIYVDTCCLNRPFDDTTQDKVRIESEAILTILDKCERGVWGVFGSDALDDEIDRIVNPIKRMKVLKLYSSTSEHIEINDDIVSRAREFQKQCQQVKPNHPGQPHMKIT